MTKLIPNAILRGPLCPEPMQVIVTLPKGDSVKLLGKGLDTSLVHELVLSPEQIASMDSTPEKEPFDGDIGRFRLGVEAMRLQLAYEYNPYFALSIAHADHLPHQLAGHEAECEQTSKYQDRRDLLDQIGR